MADERIPEYILQYKLKSCRDLVSPSNYVNAKSGWTWIYDLWLCIDRTDGY
jgi:hypothetical protein